MEQKIAQPAEQLNQEAVLPRPAVVPLNHERAQYKAERTPFSLDSSFAKLGEDYLRERLEKMQPATVEPEKHRGFFVLILANLHYSGALDRLSQEEKDKVEKIFGILVSASSKIPARDHKDDEKVIIAIKENYKQLAAIPKTETLQVGPYIVEFNPLRALRHRRAADISHSSLYASFNPKNFNYGSDKGMDPEASVEFGCSDISLMFNKFPFASGHSLFVYSRNGQMEDGVLNTSLRYPQFFNQRTLEVISKLRATYPKRVFAWNALGAYGSVNHGHIQAADDESEFPITTKALTNSQVASWPVAHKVFIGDQSLEQAAQCIREIHNLHFEKGNSSLFYNFLSVGERVYLFFRTAQELFGKGIAEEPDDDDPQVRAKYPLLAQYRMLGTGPAFAECAGRLIVADAKQFNTLKELSRAQPEQAKTWLDQVLGSVSYDRQQLSRLGIV